jgi:hypothetical protein
MLQHAQQRGHSWLEHNLEDKLQRTERHIRTLMNALQKNGEAALAETSIQESTGEMKNA